MRAKFLCFNNAVQQNPERRFDVSKMHLSPHAVASADVRSKVVVLLLLIHCLLLLPLLVWVLCLVLVLLCSTWRPF